MFPALFGQRGVDRATPGIFHEQVRAVVRPEVWGYPDEVRVGQDAHLLRGQDERGYSCSHLGQGRWR